MSPRIVGPEVFYARVRRGVSLVELAARLGTSPRTLRRWEGIPEPIPEAFQQSARDWLDLEDLWCDICRGVEGAKVPSWVRWTVPIDGVEVRLDLCHPHLGELTTGPIWRGPRTWLGHGRTRPLGAEGPR